MARHIGTLISRTVERERLRPAPPPKRRRQPRVKKRPPKPVSPARVRSLAASLGGIGPAARLAGISPRTLIRWERKGAPASQAWRLRDLREQRRLLDMTRKMQQDAVMFHLQKGLLGGVLPERRDTAEHDVKSYRRVGRYRLRTWQWMLLDTTVARRALAWARKPLGQFGHYQLVVSWAQFGESEESVVLSGGSRNGINVGAHPNVDEELPFDEEVTIENYWNSQVHDSQDSCVAELREWLERMLASGLVAMIDVTELRGFDWRHRAE
jgi:hypothetical protein